MDKITKIQAVHKDCQSFLQLIIEKIDTLFNLHLILHEN